MSSDAILLQWLVTLERDGLALLTGAPQREGVLKLFSERVGFMKTTFYG